MVNCANRGWIQTFKAKSSAAILFLYKLLLIPAVTWFLKIMAEAREHLASGTFADFLPRLHHELRPLKKVLDARKAAEAVPER